MICISVTVWHNSTQQYHQAACSARSESLCCWMTLSWNWTCPLENFSGMLHIQHEPLQSTPALFLVVAWSNECDGHPQNKRPDSRWLAAGRAAKLKMMAVSAVHTSHLLRKKKPQHISEKSVVQNTIKWIKKPRHSHSAARSSCSRISRNMICGKGYGQGKSFVAEWGRNLVNLHFHSLPSPLYVEILSSHCLYADFVSHPTNWMLR